MKAIRVQRTGGPEVMELEEVPLRQPKPAEVVVKVSAAGVNAIDGYFRDGRFRTPLPFIPGQEGAGVVTELGAQAKTVKVGDRVAWSGVLGSYAEFVVSPEELLVPVPAAISDEQAAAAMVHGLLERARPRTSSGGRATGPLPGRHPVHPVQSNTSRRVVGRRGQASLWRQHTG
jgi:NADPH2:quinone reductase